MIRFIFQSSVLIFTGFLVTTVVMDKDVEPNPIPSPAPYVQVSELPEHLIEKRGKGPILDCDKRRDEDLTALACNVYHEARNQPVAGQRKVAWCTHNRVLSKRYPDTYAGVVWDARYSRRAGRRVPHMSWTLDGKPDRVWDKEAWATAVNIAMEVMFSEGETPWPDCIYWHSKTVEPAWSGAARFIGRVGDHIFYAEK